MEQINIAALLKNCPTGMELDCLIYDNVYFKCIREHAIYPIVCYTIDSKGKKEEITFNWYGKYMLTDTAKCVIFPKGKITWEGFVPPEFKDGDILVGKANQPFIFQSFNWAKGSCFSYCGIDVYEHFWLHSDDWASANSLRFATKEEEEKLLKVIKKNGYKWHVDTRILEKLIEPKFNNGDILTDYRGSICIYKGPMSYNKNLIDFYCGYRITDHAFVFKHLKYKHFGDINEFRLATEEEKQKLFQTIKDNGYKWNPEIKTLEELVVPIFKVGDRITNGKASITIGYIDDEYYYEVGRNIATRLFIKNQDEWNLVPNKFDIRTLKPFESKVLVRDDGYSLWQPCVWGLYDKGHKFPYVTTGCRYRQCIPYKGNEYLLGKTESCKDFYKTWE